MLVPIFIVTFYFNFKNSELVTAALFALAAFTDWLDGYLARTLEQTTKFGAFLDPVADKLIVSTALVLLVGKYGVLALPALVIISREIIVSALREWMAEIGKRASVAVSYIGKIKTMMQVFAIVLLLAYSPALPVWVFWFASLVLYCAVGLTLWSMWQYLRAAMPDLLNHL